MRMKDSIRSVSFGLLVSCTLLLVACSSPAPQEAAEPPSAGETQAAATLPGAGGPTKARYWTRAGPTVHPKWPSISSPACQGRWRRPSTARCPDHRYRSSEGRSRTMTWCVPAWWGGCRGHPGGGRGACEADSLKQAPKARDRCFRCYVHCDASPDITQITHQGVFLAKESQSSAISQWVMRPTY